MNRVRRNVLIALIVSQALVLTIIESFLPINFFMPGMKLGLANITTLIALTFLNLPDTLVIVFLRCFLSSLFSGNLIMFWFSIAGGISSTLIMFLMLKRLTNFFSIFGVCIAGAVVHNLSQLFVARLVLMDNAVLYLIPILLLSGLIMGSITGYLCSFLIKIVKRSNLKFY